MNMYGGRLLIYTLGRIATTLDYRIVKPFHHTTPFDIRSVRSILLIESSRMGDVVMMLRMASTLQDYCVNAEIFAAVRGCFAPLVRCFPEIRGTVPLEGGRFGLVNQMIALRRRNYDLALNVSPSLKNALLTMNTSAFAKMGFFHGIKTHAPYLERSKVQSIGIFLEKEYSYHHEHIQKRSLKILQALGIHDRDSGTKPVVPREFLDSADTILNNRLTGEKPLVIIHPFAEWSYRRWPLSNFLFVGRMLHDRGCHVMMVGDKADCAETLGVDTGLSSGIQWVVGESLGTMVGLLAKADVFIGNDSGPLHVASLLDVPSVGLFGPASPQLTGPVNSGSRYFFEQVECHPCGQIECVRPEDPCIRLIRKEDVLDAALTLLKESR